MKYRLNINFAGQDIKSITESRQKVVLIKQTKVPSDIVVAWVCFNPFIKNLIEWDDGDYSIYASASKIEDVTIINKLYEEQALPSIRFDFKDGPFNSPIKTPVYYAHNSSEEFAQITLGLTQKIMVNGAIYNSQPINAFSVPYGQGTDMIPGNHICVLLRKNIVSSMLLPHDPHNITLNYDEHLEYTISFSGEAGRFSMVE